ncbi:MAG: TetR/AcrR family transcriptional regulator [Candidatus Aminicenantes bacterium]|nr:TetR/AcrR family transcriptional regulator [Candidatus Aminicenantes bacterium]
MRKSPPESRIKSREGIRSFRPSAAGPAENGRGGRVERKRLLQKEIRRNIIRAAERLILKSGFGRLTMDGLAREAQFSKATLYKYFRSKSEVVSAIFINYFDRIRERLTKIRDKNIGLNEQFRQFIRAVLESHEESRNLSQALLLDEAFMKKMGIILADERRVSSEDRKFVRTMKSRFQEMTAYITDFLSQGVREGAFRETNPALTVRLLGAAINGFCHRRPWGQVETDIDEAADFLYGFFMHGLAPRSGSRKGETR